MSKEKKVVGPVIRTPMGLHGKKVTLIRGGKEVKGVLLSSDGKPANDNFVFRWIGDNGVASISEITGEELEVLRNG